MGKPDPKTLGEMAPMGDFFRYTTCLDKLMLLVGVFCSVLVGIMLPAFSYYFGQIINAFGGDRNQVADRVDDVTLFAVYAGLILSFFSFFAFSPLVYTSEKIVTKIRHQYLEAVMRKRLAWFDQQPAGSLLTLLNTDTGTVQKCLADDLSNTVSALTQVFLGLGYGFYENWRLTLMIFTVVPVLAIIGTLLTKFTTEFEDKGQKAYAGAGALATEALTNITTVISFNGQARTSAEYRRLIKKAKVEGLKKGLAISSTLALMFAVIFWSYALAFYYGSYLVDWGYSKGGDIVAVFFNVVGGAFAFGQVGTYFSTLAIGRVALFKLMKVIDDVAADENLNAKQLKFDGNWESNLELEGVEFSYPNREKVLHNLNLKVDQGGSLAICGASGCGKSTLASLLLHYYAVDKGSIKLNGTNINELNLAWMRDQIGYVTQEPVLFTGSIKQNIKQARPDATDDEIIQVCKEAYIHDVINGLPEKYETPVGEMGSQLSGGQKQRVAIARAIIKKPKIMLLDEATSALDRESEKHVQEALKNINRGRTTVAIAHRMVTIKDFNEIAVLTKVTDSTPDSVAEIGTHGELMAKGGEYTSMVKTQSSDADNTHQIAERKPKQGTGKTDEASVGEKTGLISKAEAKVAKKEEIEANVPVSRLARLSKEWSNFFAISFVCCIFTASLWPGYGIILPRVIAAYFLPDTHEMHRVINNWVFGFIVLGFIGFTFGFFKFYALAFAGEHTTEKLRGDLFDCILKQDNAFFDQNESGVIGSRLSKDAENVHTLLGPTLANAFESVLTLMAGIVIAFVTSWKLSVFCLMGLPLMFIAGLIQTKIQMQISSSSSDKYAKANQIASECVTHVRTVKAFNLQKSLIEEYKRLLQGPLRDAVKKSITVGMSFAISNIIIYGAFAFTFWEGAKFIRDGEMSIQDVLQVVLTIIFSAMGVGQNMAFQKSVGEARGACRAVFKIIDRIPDIDVTDPAGLREINDVSIEFKHVDFSFPNRSEIPVLIDFNIRIPSGKVVALIGDTGCGKSTVLRLIQRFYTLNAGSVLIDGVKLEEYNLEAWRNCIGIVSQEPSMFTGTVKDNVLYGKPNATDEEVEEACRVSNIHETIISLPQGYNTEIGERGVQLSGGQKQRVAIARAVIRKPKLLLLDEATSALDSANEQDVQKALDTVVQTYKMTVVIVAHRLVTVEKADFIAVLHKGKVVEYGPPEELLKKDGEYARRYKLYHGIE